MIIRIINALQQATKQDLVPLQIRRVERCIVYKIWQTETFQHRLELRIIGFSLADVEATAKLIISTIGDIGDANKLPDISSIRLNGGGVMTDNETNTVQRILYFDITSKEN